MNQVHTLVPPPTTSRLLSALTLASAYPCLLHPSTIPGTANPTLPRENTATTMPRERKLIFQILNSNFHVSSLPLPAFPRLTIKLRLMNLTVPNTAKRTH